MDLSGTQVTDDGLRYFKDCTSLEDLNLYRAKIGDAGIVHLTEFAKLQKLQELHLSNTQVTAKGLLQLQKLKCLSKLGLVEVPFGNEGASGIAKVSELEFLNIEATGIGDAGLMKLAALSKLRKLHAARNPGITQAGIDKLAASLPQCNITWDGPTVEPKKK